MTLASWRMLANDEYPVAKRKTLIRIIRDCSI
jgi:hypothetical protein